MRDLVNCDYVYDYLCQEGYVIVIVCLLFVSLLATSRKTCERICVKLSGKVGNGPINKWLSFGGDLDHRSGSG